MAGKKISELTALGATFGATDLFEISKASGGGFVSRKITGAEMTSSLPGTTYTAGDGLDLTGTVFSTDLKSNGGLVIESTELAVDLGASSITGTLAVGDGGTGASTLTDGGILLGSGTGAVTAMAALGNGVIVVGDGSTDPTTVTAFTASDGTLKHEIGGIETDISAITTGDILAGSAAGTISIVAASGASDGDVLTIQADGTCDWEAGGGGGASVLDGLTDVKSTSDNSLWIMNAGAGNACVTGTLSTATDNLGIGTNALNAITSADYNIAIGLDAGTALTTSAANVMIGRGAGAKISTGTGTNVMIGGYDVGGEITTEVANVMVGYQAGAACTSPSNTLVGHNAGKANSTAGCNTFIGDNAGTGATGQQNVAIGYYAANSASFTGNFNIAIGSQRQDFTSGAGNVEIGQGHSTAGTTTGSYNVAIGYLTGVSPTASSQIAIGNDIDTTQASSLFLGESGKGLLHGDFATAGQTQLGINLGNTWTQPTATLHVKGEGTTNSTTAFLVEASDGDDLFTLNDAGFFGLGYACGVPTVETSMHIGNYCGGTTGLGDADNTFVGMQCGYDNNGGTQNTFVGKHAGRQNETADKQTFIGMNAGGNTLTGGYNTYVGYTSGSNHTTSTDNVFVGSQTGMGHGVVTAAHYNTAVGSVALFYVDPAALGNVAMGYKSAFGDSGGITGDYNVSLGYYSLIAVSSGSKNVCVGYQAGNAITTGANNTAIGNDADCAATVDNQIAVGNGAVATAVNEAIWGNASIATNNITVDWTVTSDERIKDNISDSSLGLDFINALRPVTYTKIHPAEWDNDIREDRYKEGGSNYNDETGEVIKDEFDTDKTHDGLIAQEVKAAMESIGVDFSGWDIAGNGKQSIQYSKLVVPLIKAIQELSAKVKELENK